MLEIAELSDKIKRFARLYRRRPNCMAFHLMFVKCVGEGVLYYDMNHVRTFYNGVFWDIDGWTKERGDYLEIDEYGFSQYCNLLSVGERYIDQHPEFCDIFKKVVC